MGEPPQTARFDLGQSLAALAGRQNALIYMHDNPDPDALAAALGLGRLFERELGTTVTLGHGGIVGRAQNRAMVETLGIRLTPVDALNPDAFDLIAMVDSQPETGNNSLPRDHRIDVVIDHHPPRPASARAPWCDVRANFGATCTIVFEYLRARGVPIDAKLATAFFFALRTETRDLGREATAAERSAYLELVPLVDHNLLYRMTHPKVPRAHFAALDRALRSAEIFGTLVAVNLGTLGYPDLVAEIADLLLSYEGAKMVLCIGEYQHNAYLSLRTEVDNARAGAVMRHIVAHDGAAGGHGTMAGARLQATLATASELEATFREMVRRLAEALGIPGGSGEPLLKGSRGQDEEGVNDG
ncbi:MAG TPA: DHH family phosphoesterase [Polyangia bacterium]|nr:DHH family phosphoesterase [Polyangia bacterium]